ncbi:TIGR01777 family protein [Hymenobacter sp. UV11]|uniref:TIGR01777 family oxidoreductase n=1 Tax=Hymenobacter sp. UV11 TaxID=1849735 RepID=UPI0010611BE6|nr:TIGR01777 family oxidoreductase [Hymenobacter sp. UV11]TDN38510.1 TIGR01777 family protein [Hymenobacter sp. UV11]TFZ65291.1 TIGR01777 family protein [Hymenobacter sp. UV11]
MNILITGGTGLIGTRLAELLTAAGHHVALLSRSPKQGGPYPIFGWDTEAGTIDPAAVPWADSIVNLAGANVGEGRWTDARKRELRDSRLTSLNLLHRELAQPGHHVGVVVSASAIGLYGDTGEQLATEETRPAASFLASLTRQWEAAAAPIAALGIRLALPRIGVVLSTHGGALPAMATPTKLGLGAALGSGRQYISWIHIDDLCRLLIAMLTEAKWQGPTNAVAPYPATNQAFTEVLAAVLHRPLLLPRIPAFALRLLLGEQSSIVLDSTRVSAAKALAQGFAFEYSTLRAALKALYASK